MQCHTRVTRKSRGEEGEGSAEPGWQPAVMEATVLQVADRARVGPEAPAVRGGGRPAEVAGSMGQADALGPCRVMGAGDAARPTRPFCRPAGRAERRLRPGAGESGWMPGTSQQVWAGLPLL